MRRLNSGAARLTPRKAELTRRTLLRHAAVGSASLAIGGAIPGWARKRVVAAGEAAVGPREDFTAKPLVSSPPRLAPGERYYYRFFTETQSSPVGRFQTLRPPD